MNRKILTTIQTSKSGWWDEAGGAEQPTPGTDEAAAVEAAATGTLPSKATASDDAGHDPSEEFADMFGDIANEADVVESGVGEEGEFPVPQAKKQTGEEAGVQTPAAPAEGEAAKPEGEQPATPATEAGQEGDTTKPAEQGQEEGQLAQPEPDEGQPKALTNEELQQRRAAWEGQLEGYYGQMLDEDTLTALSDEPEKALPKLPLMPSTL